MKRNAYIFQISGQDLRREARLLLVQVDGNEFKVNRRAGFHLQQDVEHAVAVFAARHADHHAVAFFNHVELADGLTHLSAQAFFELVRFAFNFDGFCFLVGNKLCGLLGAQFGCRFGFFGHGF